MKNETEKHLSHFNATDPALNFYPLYSFIILKVNSLRNISIYDQLSAGPPSLPSRMLI